MNWDTYSKTCESFDVKQLPDEELAGHDRNDHGGNTMITNYSLEVAILLAATSWWQECQSAFWQHESRGIHQRRTYQSTFSNGSTIASVSPSNLGKLNLESEPKGCKLLRRGVSLGV